MCGIVGYLDKQSEGQRPLGATILAMLQALSCRGPDSAGVALAGPRQACWILQIKLPEHAEQEVAVRGLLAPLRQSGMVLRHETAGSYLRVEYTSTVRATALEDSLLEREPGSEIVSIGHQLEIVMKVGHTSPLYDSYVIS